MTNGMKIVGAGLAVAAVGLFSVYAIAQPGYGFRHGPMGMGPGMAPMMMMMGQVGDPSARLDFMKSELGIKPDQAGAWDAYTKTVKDSASSMMKQREEFATKVEAESKKLIATLDDTQKQKARYILPGTAGDGRHMGMGPGYGWRWRR